MSSRRLSEDGSLGVPAFSCTLRLGGRRISVRIGGCGPRPTVGDVLSAMLLDASCSAKLRWFLGEIAFERVLGGRNTA